MRTTARIASQGSPGIVAEGEAPGCCGAIRTRSACGLVRKRSGGSSLSASPSTPAETGAPESTSNDAADHCCTRFPPPRAGSEYSDPEHARVQTGACAGGDRAAEPVRVVGDKHDRGGFVLAVVGTGKAQVERVSVRAEYRRHRLSDGSQLRVAVPLALDRLGVHAERDVVHEHAAVDLGEVHHSLAPAGEGVQCSHDVVAIDAEIECEMVACPGRHTHVRKSPFGSDRGDDRLRAVAAGHADARQRRSRSRRARALRGRRRGAVRPAPRLAREPRARPRSAPPSRPPISGCRTTRAASAATGRGASRGRRTPSARLRARARASQ